MEFLWEGENKNLPKRCSLKILLVESAQMKAKDVAKVETLLRQLALLECPYLTEIYSFGVYEHEINNKPCLVIVVCMEQLAHRLEDLHKYKIVKKERWREEEILWILSQVFKALVACKEQSLTHGNLKMDNIILSGDLKRITLRDFDLKLPKVDNLIPTKRVSSIPGKSIFMKAKTEREESIVLQQVSLDPNDIKCLHIIINKLMSGEENFEMVSKSTQENDEYAQKYFYVNEALKKISEGKPIEEINAYFAQMIDHFDPIETFAWAKTIYKKPVKLQDVELLLQKIEVHRWVNNSDAVIEEFMEAVKAYKGKEGKVDSNYQQYIKCGNKIIKQYLELKDFLQARDLARDLNVRFKTDENFKRALRVDPEEYINFTFLMGNIEESLKELDKAIEIYEKGIKHSIAKKVQSQDYQNALRRLVGLLLEKNREDAALEYLKLLIECSDQYKMIGSTGADAFIIMGDIMTKQDKPKQGVKLYSKALELLEQGTTSRGDSKLKIYEKLAHAYSKANEEEKALYYEMEALNIKKRLQNKHSPSFKKSVKRVAEMCIKTKKYNDALKYYETYFLLVRSDGDFSSAEYMEALKNVANLYLLTDNVDKALKFYYEYSETVKKTFSAKSKHYLMSQDYLVQTLFKKDMLKQCLDLQLNILQTKLELFAEDDYYVLLAWNNIGNTCYMLERYDQALEYHLKCLNVLDKKNDEVSRNAREQILFSIAADYKRNGNYGKGLEYLYMRFQSNVKGNINDAENTVEIYEALAAQNITGLNFNVITRDTL